MQWAVIESYELEYQKNQNQKHFISFFKLSTFHRK